MSDHYTIKISSETLKKYF